MKIVSFNFNKISIEKKSSKIEKLNIKTKIDISEIKKLKSTVLKTKEDLLEVSFEYNISYEPEIADIELKGVVILALDSKDSKEILKNWGNKKMSDQFKLILFNVILRKSNIKALQLEDEMNLPIHLNLPTLKKQDN